MSVRIYSNRNTVLISDGTTRSRSITAGSFTFSSNENDGSVTLLDKSNPDFKYTVNTLDVRNESGAIIGPFQSVVDYLGSLYTRTETLPYITCETLPDCTTIQTIQSDISAIEAVNQTQDDLMDIVWSAGAISGFTLTDNGDGSANLSSGVAYLRTSASETAPIEKFNIGVTLNIALTDGALNYVFLDYNAGSPVVDVSTNVADFNCLNKCILWLVTRVGTTLYYQSQIAQNVDSNRKLRRRFIESELIFRAQGIILSATLLKVEVTAGIVFFGLYEHPVSSINTGVSDSFTYVYDNMGTWTRVAAQTDIDNAQYSNGAGLLILTNNKWKVDWLYVIPDSPDAWFLVYGEGQYNNYQEAKLATPPALPPELASMGMLVGRYIIQKSAATPYSESAFNVTFHGSEVPALSDLTDANITTPSIGAALTWDGTDWVDDSTAEWTIDFMDEQTIDIYPTYSCAIDSVTDIQNAPTTTILLNAGAYVLGDPIVSGDVLTVSVDIASVIALNISY